MENVKKFVYYLKKSGLRQTMRLVLGHVWGSVRVLLFRSGAKVCWNAKAPEVAFALAGKTVMVFTPSVEWNFLFQRAQQMAHSFAQQPDTAVLFLTTQRHYDSFFAVHAVEPGVFLINECLANRIDQLTRDARKVVSCVYNIAGVPLLVHYHSDQLEYEYVDDLTVTVSGTDDLEEKLRIHRQLLERADLTVATAKKLYDEALQVSRKVVFAPNAADYAFFSAPAEPNPALHKAAQGYTCVLEYYGALASWFDYDLVRAVAERHPDWLWLLIGKKIDNDMERSGIERLPNVRYVPSVPYQELPGCIACADVMTIPFVLNEITAATSPVKLFEYMASKKPILTSDMDECRRYASVRIYHDADSFIRLAEQALAERNDPAYLAQLEREAQENTWSSRARQVLDALQDSEKKELPL